MTALRRAALATAVALPAALPAAAGEADADAVRARLENWTADFNAGRSDRVCDLFAPDLRANYRGVPEKDFDTLCEGLREALADDGRAFRYRLELDEILVSGDMAIARLVWHLDVTDRASGAVTRSSDRGLDVFARQPDGRWRIVRFLGYEE